MKQIAALAVLLFLVAGGTPAAARPGQSPSVDVQSAAGLAPDGRSLTVQVLASCPERWTVVEAAVTVLQPQASGRGSFSLPCIGSPRMFTIVVPSAGGAFELGRADVTATLTVERGKTETATDFESVFVQPVVRADIAGTALLESGGAALTIDVTVACSAGASGAQSYVNVSQGQAIGSGLYTPLCDGAPHTLSVRVDAAQGAYQAGPASALTFAAAVHAGIAFFGIDEQAVVISG
jgi:hypothetical protein